MHRSIICDAAGQNELTTPPARCDQEPCELLELRRADMEQLVADHSDFVPCLDLAKWPDIKVPPPRCLYISASLAFRGLWATTV